MNIVLVEPEIPPNTGNIARTCAATGTHLHLIEPLGFVLDDKHLKRAGLDYWQLMEYTVYKTWTEFLERNPGASLYYLSTKAPRDYTQVKYGPDDYLVFGKETKGLDEQLLSDNYDRCLRIPMREEARSLNLANSVAIVLYEALRQQGFPRLSGKGKLHGLPTPEWKDA
ncbi:MAG: tRNA (uridine(34)/cytosine(34)/5-carboxymethylaminomethyluridine(34)-2'-O)-methyltransferase TrmL [Clostridia bacterium]|nr:tRNA (uridine(34)/cytosine(34)/5-carboxymethylaminomethyluridine(34)-2'-O)-methyltransferase TrmL [Clostridia bacterium]